LYAIGYIFDRFIIRNKTFNFMKIKMLTLLLMALCCAFKSYCQDTDPAVSFSAQADNKFLCPNKKEVYLYLEAKGGTVGKRLPLNVSLVVDRSGSMAEEERMHHAKQALIYFIDHLNPDDNVSIVMYDHVAELVHGSEPVRDKADITRKIHHHITPRGATNISHGLELGYNEVKSTYSPDRFNRVILISDGIANQGITDDYLLESIVREHAAKDKISLSSFGFGHEFNEVLMHDMAESGGGNYYFIETSSQAIQDFDQEFQLLGSVAAKSAVVAVNVPQGLTLSNVYGHKYTTQNGQVYIDLKEVHPGEVNGILLKFTVNTATPPDALVFNATLDYDNAENNSHHHKQEVVTVTTSPDPQACQNNVDMAMLEKISFYSSNALLDGAMTDVEYGRLEHAQSKVHQAKTMISSLPAPSQSNPQIQQQGQLINEYDTHLTKHGANTHQVKNLHKRIRHKNYKLRKNKAQPATTTPGN